MSTAVVAVSNITDYEREQARLYLEQTRNGVLGAIQGLSEGQWWFRPGSEQWSIAEVLEHIAFVQELVAVRIQEQLPNAPEAGERDNQEIEAIILGQVPMRLQKYPVPEFAKPKGVSPGEGIDRFIKSGAGLGDMLETAELRGRVLESPPIKAITRGKHTAADGYQWLLLAAAHTERHTKQILEVRAHPDFPV